MRVEELPAFSDGRHEDAHAWRDTQVAVGIEQVVQAGRELGAPLQDDLANLQQDGAKLVYQGYAFADELVAHPMQELHVELWLRLERDEPHGRTGGGLRDRLGVAVVILVGFDVGPHILGRHHADGVALSG